MNKRLYSPKILGCVKLFWTLEVTLLLSNELRGVSAFSQSPLIRNVVQQSSALRFEPESMLFGITDDPVVPTEFNIESLLGDDGIYHCVDGEQHKAFLEETKDKLVILKVYAPWCRACKGLEPKFKQVSRDPNLKNIPIVFSSLSIQNNKDYVKTIGVLALPTVQFYLHGKKMDNFPCGPSKVPILKRKLTKFVNDNVDSNHHVKSEHVLLQPTEIVEEETPKEEESHVPRQLSREDAEILANTPYLKDLNNDEFDVLLEKSKVLTFESGSVIMREGNVGKAFYVILDGEAEICQKTAFEDPLTTPSSYLGTVINRLTAKESFGERGLLTGEPRAASIRVTEPLRVVAFMQEDFPVTCVLSGVKRTEDIEAMEDLNEKYGIPMKDLNTLEVLKQVRESSTANQVRGSLLSPEIIPGVDNDQDIVFDDEVGVSEVDKENEQKLATYELSVENDALIPLLQKFRLVRLISRCFDYITKYKAEWGSPGIRNRRAMLVTRLTETQRVEFTEAFDLVDESGDGIISVSELQEVMSTAGEPKPKSLLLQMTPARSTDGEEGITKEDFMGIMAEAEFYYLFREIFSSLDKKDSGFVKAKELDRVLCGVRGMIDGDRSSIIRVEDTDMLIDYEVFTKMLIGTQL